MIYSRSGLKRERSCTSMATVGMFYKVGQRGVKMIRDYEGKLIDKSLRNKLIGGFSLEKQRSQSKSVGKIYYPRVVIKENVGGARKELYEFEVDAVSVKRKGDRLKLSGEREYENSKTDCSTQMTPTNIRFFEDRNINTGNALKEICLNMENTEKNFTKSNKKPLNVDHQGIKTDLQSKVKQKIGDYDNGKQEISFEMKTDDNHNQEQRQTQRQVSLFDCKETVTEVLVVPTFDEVFDKLVGFNDRSLQMPENFDTEFTRRIGKQIRLEEKLRVLKVFVDDKSKHELVGKMKEIIKEDKVPSLEIAAEEYDPFLVEKYMQFLKEVNCNAEFRNTWLARKLIDLWQNCEQHWTTQFNRAETKYLFPNMFIQFSSSTSANLTQREFSRYLSIKLKSNLRNRNTVQIYNRIKGSFLEELFQREVLKL